MALPTYTAKSGQRRYQSRYGGLIRGETSGSDTIVQKSNDFSPMNRLNRAVRQASQGFDGRWIYTDTDHDNQGRVKRSSRPYYATATVYWTTPTYDDLVRIDNPDASWSTVAYNGLSTVATNPRAISARISRVPGPDQAHTHQSRLPHKTWRRADCRPALRA